MAFLTITDYEAIIETSELNVLTGNSDVTRLKAETMAINKVKHLIGTKYDIDVIFDEDGERDETVIEYVIYYALYILFTKIAKVKVPADRYAQYREASDFFKSVANDTIQTNLPRKAATDDNDFIDFKFSSNVPYETNY